MRGPRFFTYRKIKVSLKIGRPIPFTLHSRQRFERYSINGSKFGIAICKNTQGKPPFLYNYDNDNIIFFGNQWVLKETSELQTEPSKFLFH
ncbi:hypothetical protein BAVI_11624 [Neobacillus vireti LMG 21834]|uniref:Uncharacterized protein n=1 Tax=Neobacillus vireti LMG 21834 TaxID=1131730 RepID=A0AB94INJ4_9BACI|nr:hypothetical protein BAVI_11624 [Neobacillus vireti LMG 21834]KLT18828.1 hypothetical protein AA980_07225 [Neobacillus vireti]